MFEYPNENSSPSLHATCLVLVSIVPPEFTQQVAFFKLVILIFNNELSLHLEGKPICQ